MIHLCWRRPLGVLTLAFVFAALATASAAGVPPQPTRPTLQLSADLHALHSPALHARLTALAQAGPLPEPVEQDVMDLNDEPGNWFRSRATGTPVTSVPVGGRVQFHCGDLTNTRHTATLISRPPGSTVDIDQDDSKCGGIANFEPDATLIADVPGLYLFLCKVHPYMTGVVIARRRDGTVPDVTAAQLPFIGFLGVQSLPASAALAVLPTIAPTDEEKAQRWDIGTAADQLRPAVPGVGEVWVDTQFEHVPDQTDDHGVEKPGTITVVDATSFSVADEVDGLDPEARFRWNNPHNMWADTTLSIVYNGHWFGHWHNKIARATGDVLTTIEVGEAPTHTVSNPNERSPHFEHLTLPQSAEDVFYELEDPFADARTPAVFNALQRIIDNDPTGFGRNHPHAQWLTSDGQYGVYPNVFKDQGIFVGNSGPLPTVASSPGFRGGIGVVDQLADNHDVVREFRDPNTIRMPVATGIQGVTAGNKAYVANIISGQVSVIDLNTLQKIKDIPVTLTPNCLTGPQFDVFSTLQVPIQLPVTPDGRFVGVAVLSLTTVPRACTGFPDHVAVIDTATDTVVKFVGIPARPGTANGAHGGNVGAKEGGGYYLYVASQFSNMMTVVDIDPAGTGTGAAASVVGRIFLANGAPGGPRVTDGVGGQGIKPLPNVYDGWIQDTVAADAAGQTDAEVKSWIARLTRCQKDPAAAGCRPAGPGR
jgi:YVTN family beta-propeller protein